MDENEEKKTEQSTDRVAAPAQVIVQQTVVKTNGLGVAGFVLSLLCLILCWVPALSVILWILGFILSLIGVFTKPRGLAVTGLVLTFIDLFAIILF